MAEQNQAKQSGKLKTILILVVAVILAVALSVAGTLFFLSDRDGQAESGADDGQTEPGHVPASYYSFERPLVVSVESESQQRYLQVHLALVMRDDDLSDELELHTPTLRSRLQNQIQGESYEKLLTHEGRENLLEQMKETVNQVLEEEGAAPIERVLYTNFVMQ